MRILCVFGHHAYGDPARGEAYEYANFLPALEAIGTETRLFDSFDRATYRDFADLNRQFLSAVLDFRPDVIFAVLMNYEVWSETLDLIRNHSPVAILHWGTDDSWKFSQFSRYMAPHVDVHVTTYPEALQRARACGLNNVVLSQWGASERLLAEPLKSADCEYDVTFIGSAYGNRRRWIEALASQDIKVRCFGHGWGGGVLAAGDIPQIYRKSRISLNFADSGLHLTGLSLSHSRQIKARTFEVPGAGGFLLTQGAPELNSYFKPGHEVAIFEDLPSLTTAIRHYLSVPDERDRIARAGFERTRREHTYATRFPRLLNDALARTRDRGNPRDWSIDVTQFAPLSARHRIGAGWRTAKGAMTAVANVAVGKRRGERAARRAVYEVYWRLRGARTYSCAGLPGRLFYI